jgi:hypothetical protein
MGYAASHCLQDFYLKVIIVLEEKIKILWRVGIYDLSPTRRQLPFAMALPLSSAFATQASSIARWL